MGAARTSRVGTEGGKQWGTAGWAAAQGWSKGETFVLNSLEQMERTQQLSSYTMVGRCPVPGSWC